MQQVFGITSVLKSVLTIAAAILTGNSVNAKTTGSKPVEILSDPYGYGVPTHYTVLRGHTKVTFTNPVFGHFSRAEISMREKNGNRITRFTLSADAKSYLPTLILFQPFEKYGYPESDPFCLDPKAPSPILKVTALGPAVKASELVAKKREELTKANFFDSSCFDPSIKEDHRNAILNAAADVFTTETQTQEGRSTYLRCLEDYGFAHESGLIQAYAKQAISEKNLNPRLRLSCTADKKAKPGEFDEESKTMRIRQSLKPDRETYATLIFHEALHSVPLQDGLSTDLIEECCTLSERCDELAKVGANRKKIEREQAVVEQIHPAASLIAAKQKVIFGSEIEIASGEPPNSSACKAMLKNECSNFEKSSAFEFVSAKMCPLLTTASDTKFKIFSLLYADWASAASVLCSHDGSQATSRLALQQTEQMQNAKTLEDLARVVPVTSPISWDVPETPLPRVGSTDQEVAEAPRPSRTIASISPLPEASEGRTLGSAKGRRDVSQVNRATRIVDTLENAARKVTTTLTLEKLDARKIETAEAFRPRSKDQAPQKLIVASLAERPLQISDISDIADLRDLTFPNPFSGKNQEPKAAATQLIVGKTAPESPDSVRETKDGQPPIASIASALSGSATAKLTQSSGLVPSFPNSDGNHLDSGTKVKEKFKVSDREPGNAKKSTTHEFEKWTATELKKFVAGSYRSVADVLENQDFAKALSKNGIQIYDHENRQIGAMEPALVDGVLTHTVFIYSAEKSRLIQSRTSHRNPK